MTILRGTGLTRAIARRDTGLVMAALIRATV